MEDYKLIFNCQKMKNKHCYALWIINLLDVLAFSIVSSSLKLSFDYQIAFDFNERLDPIKLSGFIESITPSAIIVTIIMGFISDKIGRILTLKITLIFCSAAYFYVSIINYFDCQNLITMMFLLILLSIRYSIFILSIASICDHLVGKKRYVWIARIFLVFTLLLICNQLSEYFIHDNPYLFWKSHLILMPIISAFLMLFAFSIVILFCQNDLNKKIKINYFLINIRLKIFISYLRVLQSRNLTKMLIIYSFLYIILVFISQIPLFKGSLLLGNSDLVYNNIMLIIHISILVSFIIIYPQIIKYFSVIKILKTSLLLYFIIFIYFILNVYININEISFTILKTIFYLIAIFIDCSYLIILCENIKPKYIGFLLGINYIYLKIALSTGWILLMILENNLIIILSAILIITQIYFIKRRN